MSFRPLLCHFALSFVISTLGRNLSFGTGGRFLSPLEMTINCYVTLLLDGRLDFGAPRWARRSLCTESTSRRGLFERSEFLSHLIRYGGGGTRRAAHRRKWFWSLLPKQKGLVARGRNPALKFNQHPSISPTTGVHCRLPAAEHSLLH